MGVSSGISFANHHSTAEDGDGRTESVGAEVLKVGIVLHTHAHGRRRPGAREGGSGRGSWSDRVVVSAAASL